MLQRSFSEILWNRLLEFQMGARGAGTVCCCGRVESLYYSIIIHTGVSRVHSRQDVQWILWIKHERREQVSIGTRYPPDKRVSAERLNVSLSTDVVQICFAAVPISYHSSKNNYYRRRNCIKIYASSSSSSFHWKPSVWTTVIPKIVFTTAH